MRHEQAERLSTHEVTSLNTRIEYCGYMALVCSFDDSAWIRMGRTSDTWVREQFATACQDYRGLIENHRQTWCRTNGNDPEKDHQFKPYLYNPACFLTFGHTDSVGLVLIDDIDAMMDMTAAPRSPVEQIQLAYCPTVQSLGLRNNPYFREPAELFTGSAQQILGCPGRFLPDTHSVQQKAPLFMSTRLKLNGIGMLGEGLLIQAAAYRAIATRITETIHTLRSAAGCAAPGGVSLYSEADLSPDHLWIVFLDPQGAEELSIWMFCRNYSVGVALLTALRCLTFEDALSKDDLARTMLEKAGTHAAIAAGCADPPFRTSASLSELMDNHLLSKTYTTLGVSYEAFGDPDLAICNGYLLAYPTLDINPGHLSDAEERALAPLQQKGTDNSDPSANRVQLAQSASDIHRFLVGRHDYLFELSTTSADSPIFGLPVAIFFRLMRALYGAFECPTSAGRKETGLLDISTAVVVPFPKITCAGIVDAILKKPGSRHKSIMPLLDHLRQSIFGAAPINSSRALIDIESQLPKQLRVLSLPSSLRRTIRYFYQDFARCLSDPFLFEGALDLFDTFYSLHHLLCHVLPQYANEGVHATGRGLMTSDDLKQLEDLLRAIHNAVSHRVAFSQPHWETRDEAVDFRGGLNRLVAAADVPLKCGIGVLRRLLAKIEGRVTGDGIVSQDRNRVGAVTQVTFNPNPVVSYLEAAEQHGIWLAHIDMDVAHIVNPFEYPMYIHEVSHLILRSIPTWARWLRIASEMASVGSPTGSSAQRELKYATVNLEETAVEMLTYLFIFSPSIESFRKYSVVRFNSHPAVAGITPKDALVRFGELLVRLFFVTDPFVHAGERQKKEGIASADWASLPLEKVAYSPSPNVAYAAFQKMVADVGPLFRESAVCDTAQFDFYLKNVFDDMFPRYRRSVGRMWRYVLQVYQQATKTEQSFPWFPASDSLAQRDRVGAAIQAAVAAGVPFIRAQFRAESTGLGEANPLTEHLDEFFVANRLLQTYLDYTLSKLVLSHQIHTTRPLPSGRISLDPTTPWNSVLLDPLRPGVLCIDPNEREEKLRRQIAVIKTLWDQSTHLRARRFLQMLKHMELQRASSNH
ncbi:MAG TPA: hypothetical protein VHR66_24200 [Gemmataceae bacterium]|nr:hypothetical protein [Gemmataceae bacterium]